MIVVYVIMAFLPVYILISRNDTEILKLRKRVTKLETKLSEMEKEDEE